MIPAKVEEALRDLSVAITDNPQLGEGLHRYWQTRGRLKAGLDPALVEAASTLDRSMPALSRSSKALERLARVFAEPEGQVVFRWCAASVGRSDVKMAPILAIAAEQPGMEVGAHLMARNRLVQGPLLDALSCAPLVGTGDQYDLPENEEAKARLEILLWEGGASGLQVPELGTWVFGAQETFDAVISRPAGGSLRGRVLAARCLEMCVRGMPDDAGPAALGQTLQVLQPLLLHPEPLVSTHAARALGLLAGKVEHLEAMLLDWLVGESQVLRQRSMTAFASLPAARLRALGHELTNALNSAAPEDDALAAAAAGTPYLFQESRDHWNDIAERIMRGEGGARAARELARGLGVLWRGDVKRAAIQGPLSELRDLARRAEAETVEEWRDWLAVIAATDPVDGAERDPLDVEMGLENLVHLAAQYDDEEADARAARFATSLLRTFEEARKIAESSGSLRHRAAGMNAVEGCARSMALRLWAPQLATHPRGDAVPEPDLKETWETIARAPTELLDFVKERRQANPEAPPDDVALEVLAVKLGGYALDACGDSADLGPGRGPTAHATCLWLRKLEGVADGTRDLPAALREALSSVFWRLVDTTRGSALGEVDDVEWLGPFAAWWALVIDRPAMLKQLANAIPMIKEGALEKCCDLADAIRQAVGSGDAEGQWAAGVQTSLAELHANGTELAEALTGLAVGLAGFAEASGRNADLEQNCFGLVVAAERLQDALADPVRALHPALAESAAASGAAAENAQRVAALVARAIRARELSMLDVWFTSLGPIASGLVEAAVSAAVRRTPPPPPSRQKLEAETIEGYELVKPLGEGGVGKVYLVRKPGADRLFVLKIPKREALAGASDTEREGLLASFIEEANALAGLYHPNVANIIDRGVVNDVPFLVLELLIGADLEEYSRAKLLSLFELRSVVLDACAGLSSLHGAGLVHRDIKPANIWLRLPISGGQRFDPAAHRDPAQMRPLSAVVIDFGMVRPMRVAPDAAGRFVAGTPGYIAPDQVLDPVELDGRADVYALAGTVYNATTGRAFFDDIKTPRDRIFAHMQRDPLEDTSLLKGYPANLVKLMRAATALDPKVRPHPIEFGRTFEACL